MVSILFWLFVLLLLVFPVAHLSMSYAPGPWCGHGQSRQSVGNQYNCFYDFGRSLLIVWFGEIPVDSRTWGNPCWFYDLGGSLLILWVWGSLVILWFQDPHWIIDSLIWGTNMTHYKLPIIIHCRLIGLDARMFSHSGYGPGTRAQAPQAMGPQAPAQQLLGPGPWSRVHIHYGWAYVHQGQSIGNQWAINRQYIIGNLAYYLSYS